MWPLQWCRDLWAAAGGSRGFPPSGPWTELLYLPCTQMLQCCSINQQHQLDRSEAQRLWHNNQNTKTSSIDWDLFKIKMFQTARLPTGPGCFNHFGISLPGSRLRLQSQQIQSCGENDVKLRKVILLPQNSVYNLGQFRVISVFLHATFTTNLTLQRKRSISHPSCSRLVWRLKLSPAQLYGCRSHTVASNHVFRQSDTCSLWHNASQWVLFW